MRRACRQYCSGPMELRKLLKGRAILNEPLAKHTTFGIGGAARFFIKPRDEEDLKVLLGVLKKGKIRFLIIGSGSNILVSDKGVKAAVISLSAPFFCAIKAGPASIEAGAGVRLAGLIRFALRKNLSGLEFLSGIPGTVGGALVMNAGISEGTKQHIQRCISDNLLCVKVLDASGRIRNILKKDIMFGYRSSDLGRYVILSARFRMRHAPRKAIAERVRGYLAYRKKMHGWAARSAGCVFKNPAGTSAGKLIDMCGLKGIIRGGAQISGKHANFILNTGKATAADVLYLMGVMRKRVKQKFGITLEPEIRIWRN